MMMMMIRKPALRGTASKHSQNTQNIIHHLNPQQASPITCVAASPDELRLVRLATHFVLQAALVALQHAR
jgi:hypothetical protein